MGRIRARKPRLARLAWDGSGRPWSARTRRSCRGSFGSFPTWSRWTVAEAEAKAKEGTAPTERSQEIGLHNLRPKPGSRKPRKRIGRGEGSTGKTSGRGHKGAGSRSGSKRKAGYEGGQNPIHMRMRKLRGPHMKKSMPFERFRTKTQPVNVSDLEDRFEAGAEVTPESLREKG